MLPLFLATLSAHGACPAEAVLLRPEPDGAAVFPNQELVVQLDSPVDEVGFRLTRTGITAIAGTVYTDDDITWRFFPPSPLAPDTHHTARAKICGVDTVWAFTTSSVGPATGNAALDGRAWDLQLDRGVWEAPESLVSLLSGYLIATELRITASVDTDDRLALAWSLGAPADPCEAEHDLGVNYGADPYVRAKTRSMELALDPVTLALSDVLITGGFTPDGAELQGARIEALLDTRALITDGSPPDSLCVILGALGDECIACPDGEPLCTRLDLRHIPAVADPACPAPADTGHTGDTGRSTVDTADTGDVGPELEVPEGKGAGGCGCATTAAPTVPWWRWLARR